MACDMDAKLDKIISEVCYISEYVQNMFTTLDNRINQVKASNQDLIDTIEASLQTRIYTEEASFKNRLKNVELYQGNCVDISVSEDRKGQSDDVTELVTLMDIHCKDDWEFEEAVSLFPTVTRYGMKNITKKLSNSLIKALTVTNCIQVFQLASQCEIDDLWEASKEWITKHFDLVCQSSIDFWKLSVDEMCVFVYSNTLRAKQKDVFKAISKWVKSDRIHRTVSCSILLNAVQFHQCPTSFLRSILDHYLVFANSDVQYAVEKAIKQKVEKKDNIFCKSSMKSTEGKDVLFTLGGNGSDGIIETYNVDQGAWRVQTEITNGPSKTTFAFTAEHKVLVLETEKKRLRSFDNLTKKWDDLTPLPVFRRGMAAVMEGNELFVMGGESGHESRCDVYLDTWTQVPNLNIGRCLPASSSLKGKIYCCGGIGTDGQRLSSMEVFDPKEKSLGWAITTSMLVRRARHCLVSCSQYLWAVGGENSKNYLRDFEKFEPSTNSWTKMALMPTRRSALTATFFGGRLYVIGGWQNKGLNTVEVYDPNENRWSKCAYLNKGRHCHASCVIKEIPNADKYKDWST